MTFSLILDLKFANVKIGLKKEKDLSRPIENKIKF